MTVPFPPAPRSRLVHTVLASLAGALVLCLLALNGLAPVGASRPGPSIATLSQGEAPGSRKADLPSLHADGAVLDLDDPSGYARLASVASITQPVPASLGRPGAIDDPAGEISVPLPERPPRA